MTWIAVYNEEDDSLYSMGTVVAGKSTLTRNGFKGVLARDTQGNPINPQETPEPGASWEWVPEDHCFQVVTAADYKEREILRLRARLAELEG